MRCIQERLLLGSGYFASGGKIAHVILSFGGKIVLTAIIRKCQNSPKPNPNPNPNPYQNSYRNPNPNLNRTLTQTEEKHYFASEGKIATYRYERKINSEFCCCQSQKLLSFLCLGLMF